MIVGPGKSQAGMTGWQPGISIRGVHVAVLNTKAVWRQNFILLQRPQSFLLRLSTDWMRPTHFTEGNLLYSNSTDLS